MDVELRSLRQFLAVAEELHFGRAAERLHLAQPALSQQIRKLERELDVRLFARTSRSVALTPAGELLRDRARALLAQAAKDLAEVTSLGHGEQGRLDVGFVSSALPLGPVEAVQRFRARYPLVRVHVHEAFTDRLLTRIQRGEIDIAMVRDPERRAGVRLTVLRGEPFVGVVPADHPLADRDSISGAELADDQFVYFPREAGAHAYELNLSPVTESGRRPRITQEASTWATVLHMVGAGLGVTVAPLSATPAAPDAVRVLRLEGTGARSSLCWATRADDDRPVLRNFTDLSEQDG